MYVSPAWCLVLPVWLAGLSACHTLTETDWPASSLQPVTALGSRGPAELSKISRLAWPGLDTLLDRSQTRQEEIIFIFLFICAFLIREQELSY